MQRSESLSSQSLKLRRPSTRVPTSDPDIDSPSARSRSGRFQKSISGLSDSEFNMDESGLTPREDEEEEDAEGDNEGDPEEKEEGPGKMSLMALLAETDREMGVQSAYVMAESEEEEVEEENDDGNDENGYVQGSFMFREVIVRSAMASLWRFSTFSESTTVV
ncbi:uncharacterized protein LOC141672525 [Apium graveolens]|uniref:uncharacterized protein LOC141672525 n=1 Tax=Apium graveolens TaxID=4045 RepID=UPI003D79F711